MTFTPVLDYGDDVFEAVEAFGHPEAGHRRHHLREGRAQRRHRRREGRDRRRAGRHRGRAGLVRRPEKEIKEAVRSLTKKLVRKRIVEDGVRIDGRGVTDLRPVSAEVGVLPTAHGSGLFQRGETQVLNVCTLAMPRMNQLMDTLSPETTKRYMHHYNMAPWANGEVGRVGSPKRREIGHGALAARAVLPVVPSQEEFAYSLRLVSEVLSSNGSTSMASVCASSLSLMDAGVPTKAAVAGIAMGLIFDDGKYTTLTDILGAEDAFGDMDFKVAGTADVVTALQLDTKIDGIPAEVLKAAPWPRPKDARLQILEVMNAVDQRAPARGGRDGAEDRLVPDPARPDRRGHRPEGQGHQHHPAGDRRRHRGRRRRHGRYGHHRLARRPQGRKRPKSGSCSIIDPPTANVGEIYTGKVVNITKFGAFVNILPGRDGLVHISKLGRGKRINRVEDVCGPRRRDRACGSMTSTTRARSASPPWARRRIRTRGRAAEPEAATSTSPPSGDVRGELRRRRSTPRPARSSAISDRPRPAGAAAGDAVVAMQVVATPMVASAVTG